MQASNERRLGSSVKQVPSNEGKRALTGTEDLVEGLVLPDISYIKY